MSNLVLSGEFVFNDDLGLQVLEHPEHGLVFAAFSVAAKLGYSNPRVAVHSHCKQLISLKCHCGRHLSDIEGLSLTHGITLIKESDLYRLIMRSTLPEAEAFQDWVVEKVLPAIRKYGKYDTSGKTIETLPPDTMQELEKLKQENRALLETIQPKSKPKRRPSYSRVEPVEVEQQDGSMETVWFHKGGPDIPCELYKNYASVIRAIANVEKLVESIKTEATLVDVPEQVLGSGLKITKLRRILKVFW